MNKLLTEKHVERAYEILTEGVNLEERISSEVAPFFTYATAANCSIAINKWDSDTRVHRAYANCVCCNTARFTEDELRDLRASTDSYFCAPCFADIAQIVKKYDTGYPTEAAKIFQKVWHNYLFGSQV